VNHSPVRPEVSGLCLFVRIGINFMYTEALPRQNLTRALLETLLRWFLWAYRNQEPVRYLYQVRQWSLEPETRR
jgi:hypothetical protein